MSDTICRQDAIRWVKTECNPYGKPTLEFESGKKVIEHLERMPSAQPQGWTPVTEGLPAEDGWYQVYAPDYSGGSSSGLKNIKGNMYSAFKHGKWSIEVGYHKRPGCVKAWMPLPEPYKGGQDGKTD